MRFSCSGHMSSLESAVIVGSWRISERRIEACSDGRNVRLVRFIPISRQDESMIVGCKDRSCHQTQWPQSACSLLDLAVAVFYKCRASRHDQESKDPHTGGVAFPKTGSSDFRESQVFERRSPTATSQVCMGPLRSVARTRKPKCRSSLRHGPGKWRITTVLPSICSLRQMRILPIPALLIRYSAAIACLP
jgi:hypothetical protein